MRFKVADFLLSPPRFRLAIEGEHPPSQRLELVSHRAPVAPLQVELRLVVAEAYPVPHLPLPVLRRAKDPHLHDFVDGEGPPILPAHDDGLEAAALCKMGDYIHVHLVDAPLHAISHSIMIHRTYYRTKVLA